MSQSSRIGLVWFQNDLRLIDNENLSDAIRQCDELYYIYVFDPRTLTGQTKRFGFAKTAAFRAKFLIESVQDLKKNLSRLGGRLIIRVGHPEEIVAQLAHDIKASWVFCNRERTDEEVKVQEALERNLWMRGCEIRFNRGKMLLYTQDLPFPVMHTPENFTAFRKEVEKIVPIRDPLPPPTKLKQGNYNIPEGSVPTLSDFKLSLPSDALIRFEGGETAALARLQHYFWETKAIANYKETRNELLGDDFSSKFSLWLANGCISPKLIYAELLKFEATITKNESTYWLFFELLWRDYFRLIAKKHNNKIFQYRGLSEKKVKRSSTDRSVFNTWATGQTGIPFIDANMIELNRTGYMSNRGRQNVASYLVNNLNINWLMGAEYFESLLIDYDPASNYGNWMYLAGVGNDLREDRVFNTDSQAKRYDPDNKYVNYWFSQKQLNKS